MANAIPMDPLAGCYTSQTINGHHLQSLSTVLP